jgi:hypothetical protein
MRQWVTLLLLAGTAFPAMAAKSLSVAELEQLLTSDQGKADGHVAQQLMDVELSERVSPARLARWEKTFTGNRTRELLMMLADSAAFLKPPEADVIRDPAPDAETQAKMFALAAVNVKTTVTRLPNFYAKRNTTHFEDQPSEEQVMTYSGRDPIRAMRPSGISIGKSEAKPMRMKDTYSVTVTYRDGSEVHETAGKGWKPDLSPTGLTTTGEFGPILAVVLGDVVRSQPATWSHWEQGESEPIAVFHYTVPEDRSNYMVGIPNGAEWKNVYPGYHGEIAIDPATGSIIRISVVADIAPPHQTLGIAILVEYASVTIGDHTYICPVHGVAYSKVPVEAGAGQGSQNPGTIVVQTQLNDVAFTQYHLFGSEAHIVADGKSQTEGNSPANAAPAAPASGSDSPAPAADRGR